MSQAAPDLFAEIREALGFSDEQNTITLYDPEAEHPMPAERDYKILDSDQQGNLTILVYGIDCTLIKYQRKGTGKTSSLNTREVALRVTRLREPIVHPNGKVEKYRFVKGQPSYPFFPKSLCEKYARKEHIPVLYITEGYKKAFCADMHGLAVVGLGSITHWRDKETGQLHTDIAKLIKLCKPERVVYLADGDCMNITSGEIDTFTDLAQRPRRFYDSVNTFSELMAAKEFEDIRKYFAYIKTDEIEGEPKGLDDLMMKYKGNEEFPITSLLDFGTKGEKSKYENELVRKFDITFTTNAVRKHFCLHDVNDFYTHHVEKRKQLRDREFVFYGSRYRYSDKDGKCELMVPVDTKDYIRVTTNYYKKFNKPSIDGSNEPVLIKWDRQTIKEDCQKKRFKYETFISNVPAYNGFCIVPDHFNYQPVIHNCYNQYFPFVHTVEKGETGTVKDFPVTYEFLCHIFGRAEIRFFNEHLKKDVVIKEVELGLDYLQLLLCKPAHILPILCLVSKERQTGKTTFLDYLKAIFQANMIYVGNDDLKSEFNKHWSSKLIVACDETKIDKHEVVEKVKRLATARKSTMNGKGTDQMEQDFFAKFIFLSNNEETFMPMDKEEIRFWVRKVESLQKKNTEILQELTDEIPAFLYYLKNREMATPKMERHWFQTELLKTDALRKLVRNSTSTVEKEIRTALRDLFDDASHLQEVKMTKQEVKNFLLNGKSYELNYIEHILENAMKLRKNDNSEYFKYPYWKKNDAGDLEIATAGRTGRYYTFKRDEFSSFTEHSKILATEISTDVVNNENLDLPF